MKKLLFALLMILIIAPSARAGEFGDNGLVTAPTADVLYSGELNLQYQRIGSGDLILMEYGLREGVQVGARVNWAKGLSQGARFEPTLKVTLLDEDGGYKPELAFGLIDDNLYIVASKATPYYGIRGHGGLIDRDGSLGNQFFIGVTKVLNPISISTSNNNFNVPITTLTLEYHNDFNIGAKFNFSPQVSANIGVKGFDKFTFGVGFKNYF